MILLEECWSELFLLNAVQWCLPLENNPLFNPSDHVAAIPNGKASQVAADIRVLNETLRRFRTISVDPAEFACMKAIVLFRAGNLNRSRKSVGIFGESVERFSFYSL